MSKKSTNKPKKQVTAKAKATSSANFAVPFEPVQLGELLDFLKAKGITEFEWSKGDHRIAVKTQGSGSMPMMYAPAHSNTSQPATAPAAVAASASAPTSHKTINSPFVGTFYRSPSPTSASYVEVGSQVKTGDTLCIVEAMKLMNEIEADFTGKVVEILVENGQPVEFGEPLFVIDVSK
jgi:acetyl-CoA carboxylase biotin carboxyl carrier protein